jgi:hypothetical protein
MEKYRMSKDNKKGGRKMEIYRIEKNPHDKLWYVVGYTGDGIYIPVSRGYKRKKEALARQSRQYLADREARLLASQI